VYSILSIHTITKFLILGSRGSILFGVLAKTYSTIFIPIPASDDLGDNIFPESLPTGKPAPLLAMKKKLIQHKIFII